MAISKTNSGYRAELYVDNRRVSSQRGFQTKTEAKRWLEKARVEYESNPITDHSSKKSDPTFDDLVNVYLKLHLPKIRIQTQETYLSYLNIWLIPRFKYYKLRNITPAMIMEFQTGLLETLQPKSVNNCVCFLKSMFNFGETIDLVEVNPTRKIRKIKVPVKKYVWWEHEEHIQKFLTATSTVPLKSGRLDPYRAAYRLALECGMRISEVVGLSKQDVDFERGQIHVHRQWLPRKGCYGAPKHNQIRYIGFDPESSLAKVLREAIERSPDPEIIFVNANGTRVSTNKLSGKCFHYWVKKLGLPNLTFHGLRHTFASWFMKRGGDIWQLMKFLGQRSQRLCGTPICQVRSNVFHLSIKWKILRKLIKLS